MSIILGLFILTVFFGIAFMITGALLSAAIWLFIKLPLGLMIAALGLALCCTILLIPVGISLIGVGGRLILPGV